VSLWQIASIATPDLDIDQLLDAKITFHGVLIGTTAIGREGWRPARRRSWRAVVSHELPLGEAAQAHRILAATRAARSSSVPG
jgi:hypothetical protein